MANDKNSLTAALAKKLVALHAPDELPYFDNLSNENESIGREDTDDPFAFGIGELLPAITPTAMNLASTALIFIGGIVSDAASDVLVDKTKKTINSWLNSTPEQTPELILDQHQQEILVSLLFNEALKQGVGVEMATRLSSDFVKKVLKTQ